MQRAIRGMGWGAVATLGTRVLAWVVTLAVASALSPSRFGLVAICWVLYNSAALMRDQAISSTVVYGPGERRSHHALWWLTLLLSIALGGALIALSSLITSSTGHDATPLLALFAVALVVSGVSAVPTGLVQRELRFRAQTLAELAAAVAYAGSALTLLALGLGVNAVGIAQGIGAAVGTVIMFYLARYRPRFTFSRDALSGLIRYGFATLTVAGLTLAFTNVDTVAVAWQIGGADLGRYALAFNLAFVTTVSLSAIVQRVAFPTYSSIRSDDPFLRDFFLRSSRAVLLVALPIPVLLVVFGPDAIDFAFGAEYEGAGPPLQVLSLYGLIASLAAPGASLLRARGKPGLVVRALVIQLIVAIALLAILIGPFGLVGVAWSVTAAVAIGSAIVIHDSWRGEELGRSDVAEVLRPVAVPLLFIAPLALMLVDVSLSVRAAVTACALALGVAELVRYTWAQREMAMAGPRS
jgi:PST family polysaccharide transporter